MNDQATPQTEGRPDPAQTEGRPDPALDDKAKVATPDPDVDVHKEEPMSDEEAAHQKKMVAAFCEAANVHLACEGYSSAENRAVVKAIAMTMLELRP